MASKFLSWFSYGFKTFILKKKLPYLFGLVILLTHWPEVVKEHGVSQDERKQLLDDIWELKKKGFPIVLSKAAYNALRNNN